MMFSVLYRVLHLRLIVINSQGDCPNDVVWSIYGDEYLSKTAHETRLRAAHQIKYKAFANSSVSVSLGICTYMRV